MLEIFAQDLRLRRTARWSLTLGWVLACLAGCVAAQSGADAAAKADGMTASKQRCGDCGLKQLLADGTWTACVPEPLIYPCADGSSCVRASGCDTACDFVCSSGSSSSSSSGSSGSTSSGTSSSSSTTGGSAECTNGEFRGCGTNNQGRQMCENGTWGICDETPGH